LAFLACHTHRPKRAYVKKNNCIKQLVFAPPKDDDLIHAWSNQ